MKIKIAIKHYWTGEVLFEYEKENNTLRETVLEAVRKNADLSSANLRFADLRFADLRFANLRSADLRFADLSFADLSFADLSSADLSSANLRFADLSSANLLKAKNLNSDATDFWWHVHHEVLFEQLIEPVRARINYIKNNKPEDEIALRLQLLKPVLGKLPTTEKGWERLHKKECKRCPWNGKTIFPDKKYL